MEANLIYTSQPVFSAAFAAALLHERLSAQGLAGGAVIVAALVLSLVNSPAAGSTDSAPRESCVSREVDPGESSEDPQRAD